LTPLSLAVSPVELRRAGSAIATLAEPPVLPGCSVDADWPASAALESMLAAAAGCLAGITARIGTVADALDRAARAYERADDETAGTFK
jgi:hypothetical protein